MIWWQFIGMEIIVIVLVVFLYSLISEFSTGKKSFLSLFLVLVMFGLGFSLRLCKTKEIIDFGYFLTDISFLFTYIIFTVALILGQKRFWKVK